MFGNDYKFTATVKNSTDLSDSERMLTLRNIRRELLRLPLQAKLRLTNSVLRIQTRRIRLNQIW